MQVKVKLLIYIVNIPFNCAIYRYYNPISNILADPYIDTYWIDDPVPNNITPPRKWPKPNDYTSLLGTSRATKFWPRQFVTTEKHSNPKTNVSVGRCLSYA